MLRPTLGALVLALVFGFGSTPGSAEDWSQFRGPGGQGHSTATGLPLHWSPTENIRWKTPIPGRGWSSPVTQGETIFLTAAVPSEKTQALHAFGIDATSGKITWDTTVFDALVPKVASQIHAKNSHASPTPICDGQHVFVHFGAHGTACLSMDGKIVWKTRAIEYQPQHGSGGSPVLVDGVLVFSCDGSDVQFVIALDAATGNVRWKKVRPPCAEVKRFAFGTPLVIELAGRKQIISPGAHGVEAYDPQTGEQLWHLRYTGYSVVPRPLYGQGLIYLSTSYDSSVLFAIRPEGHGDITETNVAWKQAKGIPYTPSFLLIGDELYLVNDAGVASCLDARTGRPRWTHRVGGKFSASPLFADGKIFSLSEAGEMVVFRPDKDQYVELARNDLRERSLATPAVIDRGLVIRTDNALYRVESH